MGRHYRAEDPAPGQPDPLLKARRAIGGADTSGSPDDWFRDTTTPPAAYRSTPGYAPAPDDVLSTSPAMHPVAPRHNGDEDAAELTTRLDPVPPAARTTRSAPPATPANSATPDRPPRAPRRPGPRPHGHGTGRTTDENPPAGAAHGRTPATDEPGSTSTADDDAVASSGQGPTQNVASSSGHASSGRSGTDHDRSTNTGGRRRSTSTGRHSTVSGTGGHRAVTSTGRHGTVTSTGSHRAVDKKSKRRIAAWPVACGVLAVLIVAGIFGWNWADGVLSNRAEAQAAACQEGRSTLRVATAPAVAEPVRQAAKAWNDDETVVHGHCITVKVEPGASSEVYDDLTAGQSGGTPGAWIMGDAKWPDRLASDQPDRIGASPEKIASGPDGTFTYVSLAGDGVDTVQQRAAQSFLAHLTSPAEQKRFAKAGFAP